MLPVFGMVSIGYPENRMLFRRTSFFVLAMGITFDTSICCGSQEFILRCDQITHPPSEVITQAPEAIRNRSRLKALEEMLVKVRESSMTGEGVITVQNDEKEFQLYRVLSQGLASVQDQLKEGNRSNEVELIELQLNFGEQNSTLVYRLNGAEKTLSLGTSRFALVIERLEATLDFYLRFARSSINPIHLFSEPELRKVLENARTDLRSLVKNAAIGSKFYHVTSDRRYLKPILEKGFTLTGGDAGTGVYAVFPPHINRLQKVMKHLWSASPKTLTLEFTVVPDAMILDVANESGVRAFHAWKMLNPPKYSRELDNGMNGLEAYANEMNADIIIYAWKAGDIPAVLVRDPKKIRDIRRYLPKKSLH